MKTAVGVETKVGFLHYRTFSQDQRVDPFE
jgi:hypothetical protein